VPALARALNEIRPKAVVVVMKAIGRSVLQAVKLSGMDPDCIKILAFPALGHEKEYVHGLREIITCLRRTGVLEDR
jgi:hypothetical protein